jgi:hypothetical protein
MATKKKSSSASAFSHYKIKPKVKRKGVVAKTRSSKLKSSKLYKKKYQGQGR